MVLLPYQRTFALFKSDIVNKLMNANHSFSNLPYELHCTVQEIQSNLQQTALANQQLLKQISIHINESLESISQLENETKENEILMNELNKTVETAREHVRLGKIAVENARQHFSNVIDSIRDRKSGRDFERDGYFGGYKSRDRYSSHRGGIFGGYNSRDRYSSHRGGIFDGYNSRDRYSSHGVGIRPEIRCHFDVRDDPWYKSSAKEMDEAQDKLDKQQQQLKDELAKYNAIESQLRNSSEQIMELNTTLQEQQIMKIVINALNKEFQLITERLKPFSTSLKRLIDVLMYVLDYPTIVEPLNSIYDKLLKENMIESTDLKLSKEMMDKIKQKLIYLTAKLPQMRYRRKQFHQSCTVHTSGSTRN